MTPVITRFLDKKTNTASFGVIDPTRNHCAILRIPGGTIAPTADVDPNSA